MVLIAYFSRRGENYVGFSKEVLKVGNTEEAVRMIKELVDAETFEIAMKQPYSDDYEICMRESKEDLDNDARPALVSVPQDISACDTVILAYPNYWDTMPMAVFTFLEAVDLSGKTVLPLCTNEGSDLGHSERDIRRLCPAAKLMPGLSLAGCGVKYAKPHIEKWLRDNGVI